ncbi:sugar ABC transporter permease [Paenibacillus sp. 598K]|uniref:carbohydrate ABC transporter permease n=1 Tax=Paenibacillus sp. 598K TaxID=1117987 RepID=UPI000FF9862D|nr:sugar ABC transporter permease [Paenibacillus sp. 598K]GBF75238.1 sugar ABC transporter permease [Paenibacillus sp. 598K]
MKGSSKIAPYVFIGPTLLLLSIFSLLPIAVALYISLTDMDLAGLADYANISFVGIKNYMDVLGDPVFLVALRNTLVYVVVGVPLIIMFSLGVALLINYGRSKLFKTFRIIYYLPSVTNIVAVAVVWSYLYNPGIGLFNYVLTTLGFDRVPWLTDPTIAKFSLILMALWRGIGLNMIIFIAALQGIDRSYYEAAAIDGASAWQRLTRITLPLMRFAIFFVSITTMIGWLQFFEEPLVMTEGGPLNGTVSAALFIYQNGFQYSHFGYAAAGSFILFFIIIAVTLLQLRLQRKQNEE